MNVDIWVVITPNQLFVRGSYTETNFSNFALPILFALTLATDQAVL